MTRATTRSQRTTQSQPRAGPSQRLGRSRANEEDEEDEEEEEENEEGDGVPDDDNEMDVNDGETEIKRKANELVRLALFNERKRTPLRREDISKKVLGQNGRAFNRVFSRAQEILQKTFGMELAELQSRPDSEDTNNVGDELTEARKATGIRKKTVATGSKTYILRSTLDPIIIEHAALTDEQLLEEEAADMPSDDEGEDHTPSFYGSIISWTSSDQLGPIGVLYTILALILVSGRVLGDVELRSYLRQLGLPPSGYLTFSAQATHKTLSIEQYLTNLIRQGYLDRRQVGENAKGKGTKRGRVTQADEDDGITYEWRWGTRAQSEVGEKGISQFVAEFMVSDGGDDEEEEGGREGRVRQDDAQAKLAKMTKGVERAAGGQLADIV